MPRVGFTPDQKMQSAFDYPKLFLDKGERARIVAIESEPLFEFVHTLRMPVLLPNGKPKIVQTTRFGKDVEEPEYEFVGRHICIGDYEAIAEKGVDPKGCPVCKASTETDAVKAPERRFAMHVVRYATKPGSFDVQNPFNVSLVAWTFGNKLFDTIVDFAAEWDLKKHDLLLGPCEVKQFQKFDIQPASKAEWLASAERKQLTAQVYKENQCKDLSALIAKKLSRELIEDDLAKVLHRHKQAFGKGAADEDLPDLGDADLDLGDLNLGGVPTESADDDLAGLLDSDSTKGTVEEDDDPDAAPAPAAAEAPDLDDLDSLLEDL